MELLSHIPECDVISQSKRFKRPQRIHKKHVHFASCTTDILKERFERSEFQFSDRSIRRFAYGRPILKYSNDMTDYLRRAGSSFARALSALGTWCSGITSENPNIRSDMYKQLVAQIRGTSPHLRQAAESVLQNNVHGMWFQLVDDFSMQREEYTERDIVLYNTFILFILTQRFENSAQVIGIILSNHRFLEKLDVLDIQTLILEILIRVDQHLENRATLNVLTAPESRLMTGPIPNSYLASQLRSERLVGGAGNIIFSKLV